jgi:hypothetical protein
MLHAEASTNDYNRFIYAELRFHKRSIRIALRSVIRLGYTDQAERGGFDGIPDCEVP